MRRTFTGDSALTPGRRRRSAVITPLINSTDAADLCAGRTLGSRGAPDARHTIQVWRTNRITTWKLSTASEI